MSRSVFLSFTMAVVIATALLLVVCPASAAGRQGELRIVVAHKPDTCSRTAKDGDLLYVNYVGFLESGEKFDSSYDREEPFDFYLGRRQVIAGWEQGVEGMCIGEKRRLIIPPNLAYGESGAGSTIPPGATLSFDIELLSIGEPPVDSPQAHIHNVFKELDLNGDKHIDRDEVRSYLVKHDTPSEELDSVIGQVFDNEDQDKDGLISWIEFQGPKGDAEF